MHFYYHMSDFDSVNRITEGFLNHPYKDLLTALYAVVPSIIIVVMYNFISNIEIEAMKIKVNDNGNYLVKKNEIATIKFYQVKTKKFTLFSSKFLHLTMSFYLVTLLGSLIQWFFSVNSIAIVVATIFFCIYSFFYIHTDVMKALPLIYGKKCPKFKKITKSTFFITLFIALPLVGNTIIFFLKNEIFDVSWIFLTMLYIVVWWLIFPSQYKPLTNLAEIQDIKLNSKKRKPSV